MEIILTLIIAIQMIIIGVALDPKENREDEHKA